MKKVALLCVAAMCLAACHCERKTTGTPCRKAACQCKHAQVQTECKCHPVHMGPLQQACSCNTSCKAHHAHPAHHPRPDHHASNVAPAKQTPTSAAQKPQTVAAKTTAQQTAALSALGTVKTQGNTISLTYKEPIHFGSNSDVIENDSYKEIDATAAILKNYPNAKVTVKGYTDSLGNAAYNVDLSQRRAQAVANALVKRGIKAGNVSAIGYGAADPIASNATAQGRRLNRRVELEIENK